MLWIKRKEGDDSPLFWGLNAGNGKVLVTARPPLGGMRDWTGPVLAANKTLGLLASCDGPASGVYFCTFGTDGQSRARALMELPDWRNDFHDDSTGRPRPSVTPLLGGDWLLSSEGELVRAGEDGGLRWRCEGDLAGVSGAFFICKTHREVVGRSLETGEKVWSRALSFEGAETAVGPLGVGIWELNDDRQIFCLLTASAGGELFVKTAPANSAESTPNVRVHLAADRVVLVNLAAGRVTVFNSAGQTLGSGRASGMLQAADRQSLLWTAPDGLVRGSHILRPGETVWSFNAADALGVQSHGRYPLVHAVEGMILCRIGDMEATGVFA